MNKSRLLAAALVLAPALAFATNRCDYVDCLAEERAKAAKQASEIKAKHDFEVQVDAQIAQVIDANVRAQKTDDEIDRALAVLASSLGNVNLSSKGRADEVARVNSLIALKERLAYYRLALLNSEGRLDVLRKFLPLATATPESFQQAQEELKETTQVAQLGIRVVDECAAVLAANP